jgi:hypothetical protein
VSRRLTAWLVTLPLAVAGTQVAHALAYRLVTPGAEVRTHGLAASGHGYLEYLPLVLAIGAVLVAFALTAEVRRLVEGTGGPGLRVRAWHFALVAPAIFSLQEHLERLFHEGILPWDTALAATFIVGVVLQLPFALAAYALARLLLRVARSLGTLLVRARRRRPAAAPTFPSLCVAVPRLPALALGYGSRGPPTTLVV